MSSSGGTPRLRSWLTKRFVPYQKRRRWNPGGWIRDENGNVVGRNVRLREKGALRKTHADFVEVFVSELPKDKPLDAKIVSAAGAVWQLPDKALLTKGRKVLGLLGVQKSIAEFYEVAVGFTPFEAAATHVAHIRGGIPVEKVAIVNGEEIRYVEKTAPNYQALKDYHNAIQPKPAKQVNVDQRTMVAKVMVDTTEAPKMRPRPLAIEADWSEQGDT